jgi:adenine phosphoribosyltransferase
MGEEASCNAVSAMEAATNAKPAKENGCAPAVTEAAATQEEAAPVAAPADPRLQGISDAIRVVPHFPKQGAPCSLLDLHALSG